MRLIDTAGFEDVENMYDTDDLNYRQVNKKMVQDMIIQTRNALLYSDLAIFMLDTREGIHHHDILLNNWIVNKRLQFQERHFVEK